MTGDSTWTREISRTCSPVKPKIPNELLWNRKKKGYIFSISLKFGFINLTGFSSSLFGPKIASLASASSEDRPPRVVLSCSKTSSSGKRSCFITGRCFRIIYCRFGNRVRYAAVFLKVLPNRSLLGWNFQGRAKACPILLPCFTPRTYNHVWDSLSDNIFETRQTSVHVLSSQTTIDPIGSMWSVEVGPNSATSKNST